MWWLTLLCASEGCSGSPSRASRRRASRGPCTEVFVGIDVAKARNAVAIADGERGGEVSYLGEVDASEESMRRLVKRIAAKHERVHFSLRSRADRLWSVSGHFGAWISMRRRRAVVDSRKPGDRVKTNRRDAIALAKLLRAGELTAVWVPDEGHEAMRDLVRARRSR